MLCAVSDIAQHRWRAPRAHTRPGWDQDTSVLCCPQIISLPNRPNLILQFFEYKEDPELEGGTEDSSKARSLTSRAAWQCWLLFMLPNSAPRSLLVCGNIMSKQHVGAAEGFTSLSGSLWLEHPCKGPEEPRCSQV